MPFNNEFTYFAFSPSHHFRSREIRHCFSAVFIHCWTFQASLFIRDADAVPFNLFLSCYVFRILFSGLFFFHFYFSFLLHLFVLQMFIDIERDKKPFAGNSIDRKIDINFSNEKIHSLNFYNWNHKNPFPFAACDFSVSIERQHLYRIYGLDFERMFQKMWWRQLVLIDHIKLKMQFRMVVSFFLLWICHLCLCVCDTQVTK